MTFVTNNDVCRIIMFVAYCICCIMMFVAYCFCRIITFVALSCLSHYDVCCYCVCRIITFVAILCLSHYDVCRVLSLSHYYVYCIIMFDTL